MRIALVTVGTRGDVQPYLAVGRALASRGHRVVLATHAEFEPLVGEAGLEFRPMRGGLRELVQTELGRAWLASADSPRRYAKLSHELFRPLQSAWCEDADAAVEGSDAVAAYYMAVHALHAAERRDLPAAMLAPWPASPTSHLPSPVAPWARRLPGPLRRLTWELVLRLVGGPFAPEHDAHRARVGLPAVARPTPFHLWNDRPAVHLFSERVVPRPTDWAADLHVAGFCFTARGRALDPALERFLASGPPPVYVGFGSMAARPEERLADTVVAAARRAGLRLVFSRGWSGEGVRAPGDDVLEIDEAPHADLFPRVAAVVHHGGAGTFAEGLRAGRPTIVIPFFGDQGFWAQVNERLGTGLVVRRGFGEETLARALQRVVTERTFADAAAAVAADLAKEDGAARAAELLEAVLGR